MCKLQHDARVNGNEFEPVLSFLLSFWLICVVLIFNLICLRTEHHWLFIFYRFDDHTAHTFRWNKKPSSVCLPMRIACYTNIFNFFETRGVIAATCFANEQIPIPVGLRGLAVNHNKFVTQLYDLRSFVLICHNLWNIRLALRLLLHYLAHWCMCTVAWLEQTMRLATSSAKFATSKIAITIIVQYTPSYFRLFHVHARCMSHHVDCVVFLSIFFSMSHSLGLSLHKANHSHIERYAF